MSGGGGKLKKLIPPSPKLNPDMEDCNMRMISYCQSLGMCEGVVIDVGFKVAITTNIPTKSMYHKHFTLITCA